jgi:hypothetical protein
MKHDQLKQHAIEVKKYTFYIPKLNITITVIEYNKQYAWQAVRHQLNLNWDDAHPLLGINL